MTATIDDACKALIREVKRYNRHLDAEKEDETMHLLTSYYRGVTVGMEMMLSRISDLDISVTPDTHGHLHWMIKENKQIMYNSDIATDRRLAELAYERWRDQPVMPYYEEEEEEEDVEE